MMKFEYNHFGSVALAFGIALSVFAGGAFAATITNNESTAQTIVVTEGSSKRELVVAAGESAEFCPSGCFVTLPNGDREALTGAEDITLSGGSATIK